MPMVAATAMPIAPATMWEAFDLVASSPATTPKVEVIPSNEPKIASRVSLGLRCARRMPSRAGRSVAPEGRLVEGTTDMIQTLWLSGLLPILHRYLGVHGYV